MSPADLVRLLGYEAEELPLCQEGIDLQREGRQVVSRVKDEVRAGRPALLWHAFTTAEWDVVCGFDEGSKRLFGHGSYAGLEGYASADELRTITCLDICPALGAILVGKKTGELRAREAEIAALKEAVRHARSTTNREKLGGKDWVFLEGLMAYDRWVSDFSGSSRKRFAGDSYCLGVYRSTHRAASAFVLEIADKHPQAADHLRRASEGFRAEADLLDQCVPLLGWESPEGPDAERDAQASRLLRQARGEYARGIEEIEGALALILPRLWR
jgi:hypothetical protein